MIAQINIHGQIGPSYVDEKGLFHKGVVLLDVIEQAESQPEATEFEVSINSPGGYVDIGDAIYNYLQSLKKKGKVTTIQNGLVGSIATKIFLAGDERLVDDRFQFWIHNPFKEGVSGDADELMAMAKGLEETETALRQFYMNFTKISDEGLDALMKAETGLTSDQCIKFGFATGKKSVPVLNIINPKMKKDEKSFMDHVKAFFTQEPKGVQPAKAQIPGATQPQSMVVNLADGAGSFWIEGEGVAEGVAAFLLDESGQPTAQVLADGDYKLEDGSMVSVMGGKVSKVTQAEIPADPKEEEEEMIPKSEVEAMVKAAVEAALAPVKAEQAEAILALKKTARIGVQPTKAAIGLPDNQAKSRSIASVMREKQEERRKQLNKN